MKKTFFVFAFILLYIIVLCSCGNNPALDQTSEAQTEALSPTDIFSGSDILSESSLMTSKESSTAERLIMFMDAIKNKEIDVVANMCGVFNSEDDLKTAQFEYLKNVNIESYTISYLFDDGENYTYSVSIDVTDSKTTKFAKGVSKWRAVVPVSETYSAITEFVPYYQSAVPSEDFESFDMEAFAFSWMCYYPDKPFISEQDISNLSIDERFLEMLSQSVKKDTDNQFSETALISYAESVTGKYITLNNLAYNSFIEEHLAYYTAEKGNVFQGPEKEHTAFALLKAKAFDEDTSAYKITYDIFSDFAYMNVCRTVTFIFFEGSDGGFRFGGTEGEYVTEYQPAIKETTSLTNRM